jgi:hypothetical protein
VGRIRIPTGAIVERFPERGCTDERRRYRRILCNVECMVGDAGKRRERVE